MERGLVGGDGEVAGFRFGLAVEFPMSRERSETLRQAQCRCGRTSGFVGPRR